MENRTEMEIQPLLQQTLTYIDICIVFYQVTVAACGMYAHT